MIDVDARSIRLKCGLDSKFVQRADKVSAKPIKLCLVIMFAETKRPAENHMYLEIDSLTNICASYLEA
jgi:hypothetical protein